MVLIQKQQEYLVEQQKLEERQRMEKEILEKGRLTQIKNKNKDEESMSFRICSPFDCIAPDKHFDIFSNFSINACGYSLEVPHQGASDEYPHHVSMEILWVLIRSALVRCF